MSKKKIRKAAARNRRGLSQSTRRVVAAVAIGSSLLITKVTVGGPIVLSGGDAIVTVSLSEVDG